MYNIVLCCVSAVSSSVMVTKIKEACTRDNIQALVWSIGEAGLDLAWSEADVIMLTPQVRHLESKLKERQDRRIPVAVISDKDFVAMDGDAVLKQAIQLIEESKK